jgi:hypothetical protein
MNASMPQPPAWAEALLRISLEPSDRETVSGDLLEEYRESVIPERGSRGADTWYLRQVAGFLWRVTWFWAVLFAGASLTRTRYDWLVPTTDFVLRSTCRRGVACRRCSSPNSGARGDPNRASRAS